jgi:hypothetical protein
LVTEVDACFEQVFHYNIRHEFPFF